MSPRARRVATLLGLACAGLAAACGGHKGDPSLSKPESEPEAEPAISGLPVPPADGPRLGSVANLTPVLERPAAGARRIGYLHAGATLARAREPFSRRGCGGGWYPVRPRGFVCATESATLDMRHPTLAAMALGPALDKSLPYAYARARADTLLFERDPSRDAGVREIGKLKKRAGMAVVGSWSATGPSGQAERLALLTDGRFVRAGDLESAHPSEFQGLEVAKDDDLPVAFVVKRGVHSFKISGSDVEKADALGYHSLLRLSGRFRSVADSKYWATVDGHWLRHRDVTVVQRRSVFPDFAHDGQKWIDVSVVTGTLALYEGKKPVFVTLASVNRDAEPADGALTKFLGSFEVTGKEITVRERDPNSFAENFQVFDAPWGIDLSSGGLIYGAYWHDRFGADHGPGTIELSPSDAARVFQWVTPELPEGFHGLNLAANGSPKTFVVVRK